MDGKAYSTEFRLIKRIRAGCRTRSSGPWATPGSPTSPRLATPAALSDVPLAPRPSSPRASRLLFRPLRIEFVTDPRGEIPAAHPPGRRLLLSLSLFLSHPLFHSLRVSEPPFTPRVAVRSSRPRSSTSPSRRPPSPLDPSRAQERARHPPLPRRLSGVA